MTHVLRPPPHDVGCAVIAGTWTTCVRSLYQRGVEGGVRPVFYLCCTGRRGNIWGRYLARRLDLLMSVDNIDSIICKYVRACMTYEYLCWLELR